MHGGVRGHQGSGRWGGVHQTQAGVGKGFDPGWPRTFGLRRLCQVPRTRGSRLAFTRMTLPLQSPRYVCNGPGNTYLFCVCVRTSED